MDNALSDLYDLCSTFHKTCINCPFHTDEATDDYCIVSYPPHQWDMKQIEQKIFEWKERCNNE